MDWKYVDKGIHIWFQIFFCFNVYYIMYIKDQLNLTLSYLFATKGGKYKIGNYHQKCPWLNKKEYTLTFDFVVIDTVHWSVDMVGVSEILKEWCVRPPPTSTCMCLPDFQVKLRLQEEVVEENGLVEKFDRAVEGILLPLVCLVGVLGTPPLQLPLNAVSPFLLPSPTSRSSTVSSTLSRSSSSLSSTTSQSF